MTELKAVLWDMDGTLIDSEPLWQAEEQVLMDRAGLDWDDETAASYIGQALPVTASGMIEHGLDLPLEAVLDALIDNTAARLRRDLPWQPGALRLLTGLAPLRSALVTMSHRRVAQALIDGGPHFFDAVVTGDGVSRSKPDPEPYLTAAAELGVTPAQCIAFEDSIPGAASATSAGVVTIGVQGHVDLSGTRAHEVVTTLEGLGLEDVRRIHARHSG